VEMSGVEDEHAVEKFSAEAADPAGEFCGEAPGSPLRVLVGEAQHHLAQGR
jgi:hypothetical protein